MAQKQDKKNAPESSILNAIKLDHTEVPPKLYDYLPAEALIIPKNEDELGKCLLSRLWRLNNLYWITSEKGERILFRMNPVQYKLYSNFWVRNIILKSRQHGITTFIDILALDMVIFVPNTTANITAHKLTAALDIFRNKIKLPYESIPAQLRTAIPAIKDDACQLILKNNSSVTVSTSFRSGTSQFTHISEYGKICAETPKKAEEIQTGTLETVHEGQYIVIESTAEGRAGDFYDKCQTAIRLKNTCQELGKLDYRFHFFAWYEDPKNVTDPKFVKIPPDIALYLNRLEVSLNIKLSEGQRAWYAAKRESLKHHIFREHPSTPDEAFKALITGSYYGIEIAGLREQGRVCNVPYEPRLPVYTFWDIGHKHTAIWFVQYSQLEKRHIDYYEDNSGLGMTAYSELLKAKKYNYGQHFAPFDCGRKGSNSRSVQTGADLIDVALEAGIRFTILEQHDVETRIKTTIDELKYCLFDIDRCDKGLTSLEMYRAEWDENLETYRTQPLHDIHSHGADAVGYEMMAYKWGKIGGKYLGSMKTKDNNPFTNNDVLIEYDVLA